MKKLIHYIFITNITFFISCNIHSTDKDFYYKDVTIEAQGKALPYEIVNTEPYETSTKAQIKQYAYVNSENYKIEKLQSTLIELYNKLKSYSKFSQHSEPNSYLIYLYDSEQNAKGMKEFWIGMLSKSPNDDLPTISLNEEKISSLTNLKDNVINEKENYYNDLTLYFEKRNTSLCAIYKTLYDLEGESIKQADIKYPNYGVEHSYYSKKWYKEQKNKLFNKYNIDDSVSSQITIYGMNYCK